MATPHQIVTMANQFMAAGNKLLPVANKFAPMANDLTPAPNKFTSVVHYFTPVATNPELNMSLDIHRGMYILHFSPHGHSKFLNAICPHNNVIIIIII